MTAATEPHPPGRGIGAAIDRTAAKMTDRDWRRVASINLSGAFFVAQAALEQMAERGTGRIINVSPVIGETGNIGQAHYAASKPGLDEGTREEVFTERASNAETPRSC